MDTTPYALQSGKHQRGTLRKLVWPRRCEMKDLCRSETNLLPLRRSSLSSVTTCRAPVQPRGWPRAMAPPLGFTFSNGMPSFSTQYTAWAAAKTQSNLIPYEKPPKQNVYSHLHQVVFCSTAETLASLSRIRASVTLDDPQTSLWLVCLFFSFTRKLSNKNCPLWFRVTGILFLETHRCIKGIKLGRRQKSQRLISQTCRY